MCVGLMGGWGRNVIYYSLLCFHWCIITLKLRIIFVFVTIESLFQGAWMDLIKGNPEGGAPFIPCKQLSDA